MIQDGGQKTQVSAFKIDLPRHGLRFQTAVFIPLKSRENTKSEHPVEQILLRLFSSMIQEQDKNVRYSR